MSVLLVHGAGAAGYGPAAVHAIDHAAAAAVHAIVCALLLLAIADRVARSRDFGKAVGSSQIGSLSCCNCGLDAQANPMLRPLAVLLLRPLTVLLLLCLARHHLAPHLSWLVMVECCDGQVL